MCYCEKRSGSTSKKQENLVIFFRVDGVDVSQIVLSTHTVGEALFTIDRPLVVKIIESRAHR